MNKRIRPTESSQRIIRDIANAEPLIDLDRIAQSLGGESTGVTLKDAVSPITLTVVREELAKRLQSMAVDPAWLGRRAETRFRSAIKFGTDWNESLRPSRDRDLHRLQAKSRACCCLSPRIRLRRDCQNERQRATRRRDARPSCN